MAIILIVIRRVFPVNSPNIVILDFGPIINNLGDLPMDKSPRVKFNRGWRYSTHLLSYLLRSPGILLIAGVSTRVVFVSAVCPMWI
jgi:hypothetical protein